jgi:hypothetical protein
MDPFGCDVHDRVVEENCGGVSGMETSERGRVRDSLSLGRVFIGRAVWIAGGVAALSALLHLAGYTVP